MSQTPLPPPDATGAGLREAQAWSDALTRSHSENFSVLSFLVPREHRVHFAAVYAFCRVADDLADQTGSDPAARAKSLQLLAAFRAEFIHTCCPPPLSPLSPLSALQGSSPIPSSQPPLLAAPASHAGLVPTKRKWPQLFTALAATMWARQLPPEPFHQLLDAFEQDQRQTRYETWDQLVHYCEKSANPVGHLVLMLFGYRPPSERGEVSGGGNSAAASTVALYKASDEICTALQLINFWQDVRRDLIERDRIYLPLAEFGRSESGGVTEAKLRAWMGGEVDPAFGEALMPLVLRTRAMFEAGRRIETMLPKEHRRVIRLFARGGEAIVEKVIAMKGATLWSRPRLRRWEKAMLVLREWAGW